MEPNDIDHVYRDGRHYDMLGFGAADLSFWIEQVDETNAAVLELGCGTGRISIPLAEAGFEVVGLDMSEAMLDEARRKTEGRDLPIEWVHADMREFDLKRKFGLIILPSNNLCHLLTIQDVERCFTCARKHLLAKGRFVISVFVPDMRLLLQEPPHEEVMSEYQDPDGRGKVVVTLTASYEPDTQIRRNTTWQKTPGLSPIVGHLDMRMFFPQELDALVRYNGFQITYKYAGLDKTPFNSKARLQLIVAEIAHNKNGQQGASDNAEGPRV